MSFYTRDNEVWAINPRFPHYAVSTFGRIKNLKFDKMLKDDAPNVFLNDINGDKAMISRRVLIVDTFCYGDFYGKRTWSEGEADSYHLLDVWSEAWWGIAERVYIAPQHLMTHTTVPMYKVVDENDEHVGIFNRICDVTDAIPLSRSSVDISVHNNVRRKGYLVSRVETVVSV